MRDRGEGNQELGAHPLHGQRGSGGGEQVGDQEDPADIYPEVVRSEKEVKAWEDFARWQAELAPLFSTGIPPQLFEEVNHRTAREIRR